MLNDVLSGSLRSAVALLRAGDITAIELAAAAIDRISNSDAMRACFLRPDFDQALENAWNTLQRPDIKQGLLAGIPVAHKDLFSKPGLKSSFGAHPFFHREGEHLAEALAALRASGALDLGAVHMSEFAMGPAGWSEHYGFIENPLSPAHISGGSSSGSAAIVAHGGVFAALGTDTGGSIRIPAAFCGVVGLKPTPGLVSTKGVHPVSVSLDTVGPLTRDVGDCARMLDALTGAGSLTIGPYEASLQAGAESLRVGWVAPDCLPVPMDTEIATAYEESISLLGQAGFTAREVRIRDWPLMNGLSGMVFMSEAASVHLLNLEQGASNIGGQVRERLQQGLAFPASLYVSALTEREARRQQLRNEIFSHVDVVLCPVTPCLTPERAVYDKLSNAADAIAFNSRVGAYTGIFNYLGLPALSMPMHRTKQGLAIGMQLFGDANSESAMLQVGHAIERLKG